MGGKVTDSEIIIPVQQPKAPKLEQWNPGKPDRFVQFNDPAWQWKGRWRDETQPKDYMDSNKAGVTGKVANWHWPLLPALAVCLLTGTFCGLVNGLITVQWKLPSFPVTLGMLEVARGAAYLIANS